MKPKNLEYYYDVDGRKPHFIFRQDDDFYVMTTLDDDTRGNFLVVSNDELEEVIDRIISLRLDQFHPKEINLYRYIKDNNHREQRLRCICYVLVAQGYLMLEFVSREIQFAVSSKLRNLKPINSLNLQQNQKNYSPPRNEGCVDRNGKLQEIKNQASNILNSRILYCICPSCGTKMTKYRFTNHFEVCIIRHK